MCLSVAVIGATVFAHWPVLSAQAVSFDDEETILHNPLVQNPSWHSIGRFFSEVTLSSVVRGYYRPLTLTSLMLDRGMGGRPDDFRPFHRTSLALHAGSTVLVIVLCYQVFRRPAVAALVGLLFGVHPLTVEPIAWVMERKTLLAGFFALAALSAYVRSTRGRGRGWLAASVVLYLLSLLSKPTGTPLPLMMLLMDYWPLRRLDRRAVLEKVPFFVLSAVFAVLAYVCEQRVNPLTLPAASAPLHLPLRLCYLISFYFSKVVLPIRLSSVYTLPNPLSPGNPVVVAAVAGVVLLVAVLVLSRRWTPALWVGVMMFLVGLAPTLGFIGYSWVAASDKYAYLPAVGLLLIAGWLLERVWSGGTAARVRVRRAGLVVCVLVVSGLLTAGTRSYLSHWRTTESLTDYMMAVTPEAPQPYNIRGVACARAEDYDGAIAYFSKAIALNANYTDAYNNRGNAWSRKGDPDRAIRDYTRAIELKPNYVRAYTTHNDRGNAYGKKGNYEQAIRDFSRAIELNADFAEGYYSRSVGWFYLKQYDRAWADLHTSRRLGATPKPAYVQALIQASGRSWENGGAEAGRPPGP